MARGTQLGQLITMFRAETRQAGQASLSTDSQERAKQVLRRMQALLYEDPGNDWAFLRVFPTKALVAGSRYYDAPADLNIDRIEEVQVIYGGRPIPVERGIGFDQYAQLDPAADKRSSPVERWDLRWTGTKTQIEVWPLPSEDMTLMFKCLRPLRPLVAEDDVADLDDTLIVLFSAAQELVGDKSKDGDMLLQMAQRHLQSLKSNAQSGASTIQMGLGSPRRARTRATVTVSS